MRRIARPAPRVSAVAALVAVSLVAAGCGSAVNRPSPTRGRRTATHSRPARPSPAAEASTSPAPAAGTPTVVRHVTHHQLPRGGTTILGRYRVVAYYGAPGSGRLGVLGVGSPEHAARAIEQRARQWAGYGLPVQPAMELIATVAQASPGPDGSYSAPVPLSEIRRYLAAAHRHRMLLVLDLQPGRASFLSQAEALRPLLLDPSVGLALDSEWKVGPGETPGDGLIGSSPAAPINAVARYLSRLVAAHGLPDKLLILHEFTASMLPDRSDIRPEPGIDTVFHADGFGTPAVKQGVYRQLAFPGRPFGAGFKLFFTEDSSLMPPAQVMRLRPRPDVITYQ